MTNEAEDTLARTVSSALERSVEHLDAATLSRLNRARQHALGEKRRHQPGLRWLAVGSVATLAVAVVTARLLLTAPGVLPADTLFTRMDDAEIIVSNEDLDLLADLDFVTWMIEQDDAG